MIKISSTQSSTQHICTYNAIKHNKWKHTKHDKWCTNEFIISELVGMEVFPFTLASCVVFVVVAFSFVAKHRDMWFKKCGHAFYYRKPLSTVQCALQCSPCFYGTTRRPRAFVFLTARTASVVFIWFFCDCKSAKKLRTNIIYENSLRNFFCFFYCPRSNVQLRNTVAIFSRKIFNVSGSSEIRWRPPFPYIFPPHFPLSSGFLLLLLRFVCVCVECTFIGIFTAFNERNTTLEIPSTKVESTRLLST